MRLQVLLAKVIAKMWYNSDLYKVFVLVSHNTVINKGSLWAISEVHTEYLAWLSQRSQKNYCHQGSL